MIIYDLSCQHSHQFEGWFSSPTQFEEQLQKGLINCPVCSTTTIRRIPSAVHLASADKKMSPVAPSHASEENVSSLQVPVRSQQAPQPATTEDAAASLMTAIETVHTLVQQIMTQCEDVGNQFATEARKMHYAEAPERPIRGAISHEEYEALHDEGIDVVVLPKIKMPPMM